jgi:Zn-dependent protease
MSILPESTSVTDTAETLTPRSLPPEVEAELRRRQNTTPADLRPQAEGKPVPSLSRTVRTMLLSIGALSVFFGWRFGVGFVFLTLIHELGHVVAARRLGIPVSAPVFVPFMGAYVLLKHGARSAWNEALIGIGGPVAGTLGALLCLAAYWWTGGGLFVRLAFFGFGINLLNLLPLFPLDGSWIVGAISPKLGRGENGRYSAQPQLALTSSSQQIGMGIAYVGLAGLLIFLAGFTQQYR